MSSVNPVNRMNVLPSLLNDGITSRPDLTGLTLERSTFNLARFASFSCLKSGSSSSFFLKKLVMIFSLEQYLWRPNYLFRFQNDWLPPASEIGKAKLSPGIVDEGY